MISLKGVTAGWYNFSLPTTQIYPVFSCGHNNTHFQRPAQEVPSWLTAPMSPLFNRKNFSPDTMKSSTLKSLTINSARHISRKPMPLKVLHRMNVPVPGGHVQFSAQPDSSYFEQFVLQMFLTSRLVIIVTTRQLPFHSHPSLISILHLFHPNYI